MKRERRVFSPEDRLAIIQEGQREGTTVTCRKYNLAPSLYAKWKNKYLSKGVEGLKPAYKRIDPELRALEEENERLKRNELELQNRALKSQLNPHFLFNNLNT